MGGCDKKEGKEDTAKAESSETSPILSKKLSELTEADLTQAATALGWGDKPTSTHSKGANETIIVSASKEHPDGTESPDGKKRVRMSIGLYIEKDEQSAQREKTSLEGRGYVVKIEKNRILATQYYTAKGADPAKSKEIMTKLFGS